MLARESQASNLASDLAGENEEAMMYAVKMHQAKLRAANTREMRRWVVLGAP